jgi:hypothetical protein
MNIHESINLTKNITTDISESEKTIRSFLPLARAGEWSSGTFADGVLIVDAVNGKHYPIACTADSWDFPWDKTESSKQAHNDAQYIAACNPVAIASLLLELDKFRSQKTQPSNTGNI